MNPVWMIIVGIILLWLFASGKASAMMKAVVSQMGSTGKLIMAGTGLAAIASLISLYDNRIAVGFVMIVLLSLALRSKKFMGGLTDFVSTFGKAL